MAVYKIPFWEFSTSWSLVRATQDRPTHSSSSIGVTYEVFMEEIAHPVMRGFHRENFP